MYLYCRNVSKIFHFNMNLFTARNTERGRNGLLTYVTKCQPLLPSLTFNFIKISPQLLPIVLDFGWVCFICKRWGGAALKGVWVVQHLTNWPNSVKPCAKPTLISRFSPISIFGTVLFCFILMRCDVIQSSNERVVKHVSIFLLRRSFFIWIWKVEGRRISIVLANAAALRGINREEIRLQNV